ncbi:hypothetical protein DICVIV_01777 [Dictyocaulus viviparus]|uniref:Uncharacterized protein n=1 Tax=Dictyocaulus viviparus TaxID=29172 RepID=A0A0D8Y5Q4_DICVI|nr:hypothetical protein DICVIV_01777 [Dictyocaulus viviparus]
MYSRLFCTGIGLIAVYNNEHLRPNGAGIAISNHMTPNDVQALFAAVPLGSSHGFVVTGQKHLGIIGIAISNHMTPNDVQALFAAVPLGSSHGFVVTGQKHLGIIAKAIDTKLTFTSDVDLEDVDVASGSVESSEE